MNTSIRNRNQSFQSIISDLPERRQYIFKFIEKYPNVSAQEISERTMLPINEITGRITELKSTFLIVENGDRENKFTHKKNTVYRAVQNVDERIDLVNAAFIRLREMKEKLENDFHLGVSVFSRKLIEKEVTKIKARIHSLDKVLNQISQLNGSGG